ncbi:MAG: hypothetical protein AABM67_12105 [Acidobacteriota bacterium]
MFVRFVSEEIDESSHVSAGIFSAAFDLIDELTMPDPDHAELNDLMDWFDLNLRGPFRFRRKSPRRARRSICWFKSEAQEHLRRAWQMTMILERNNVFVRMIKSRKAGYIIYEDDAQVLAEPFADVRRIL